MTHDVLIAGAGPTGLAAALFCARRGIAVRILDQAAEPAANSRALVVNPRTLALLEGTGVDTAMSAAGRFIGHAFLSEDWTPRATIDLPAHLEGARLLVLGQSESEAMLTRAVEALGLRIERGLRLDALRQDAHVVDADLTRPDGTRETARAKLLFAADGAHSAVRRLCGVDFPGSAFPENWPLFDVELTTPLSRDGAHISLYPDGLIFALALDGDVWRVFGNMADPLARLPAGTKIGRKVWDTAFHIAHRVAASAAVGRVALGGDAAHIHSPVGARGMNLGIEDAFVFAACAQDALAGRLKRIADYGRIRHGVHKSVVRRLEFVTRVARGRPAPLRGLRQILFPILNNIGPAATLMARTASGLDHDVVTE